MYTDVMHQEVLVDFVNKHGDPKESYIYTSMFKCTLVRDELEEEYLRLLTQWQIIDDLMYGQILFNCCLSNAFKLTLGHNVNIFLVEMTRVTGKEIAEQVTRLTMVIPASHVEARSDQLLIMIYRLWKVLKRVEDKAKRRERWMVGNRIILVSM
jgi:hypothetical protein